MIQPTSSRSSQADKILDSLKAKNTRYHLSRTIKNKKINKKAPSKKEVKSPDSISVEDSRQVNLLSSQTAPGHINLDLPWYRDENGRTRYVHFTLGENPVEKKKLFSEMMRQITDKFRVKSDSKTFFSHVGYEPETDQLYFGNDNPEEGKFVIGKLNRLVGGGPVADPPRLTQGEVEAVLGHNEASFLFV
jgi:hypothetical protein